MNIDAMSFLIIYNGHNGEMTKIPKPIRYHSLPDFKTFILEVFPLINDKDNIFLLTSFGIKLNFHIINEINEVYIFDKRLFNQERQLLDDYMTANKLNVDDLLVEYRQLINVKPWTLNNGDDNLGIKQMTVQLKTFKSWNQEVLNNSIKLNELINKYLKQINNIFKSLNVVFQFINNFINDIKKNFDNYYNYVKLINFKTLSTTWHKYYNNLKQFPTFKIGDTTFRLTEFITYQELKHHSETIDTLLPIVMKKFNDMNNEITDINNKKLEIDKTIESNRNESIKVFKSSPANEIFTKVESSISSIIKQIDESETNTIPQLYHHCQTFETSIINDFKSLNHQVTLTLQFRANLGSQSFKIFNSISHLQMLIVQVNQDLKKMSSSENLSTSLNINGQIINHKTIDTIKLSEDYLSLTIDLPLIFGFLIIEKRRQFEWYDFYSKGLVGNVTEQLMTIANHEKSYQKLWIKKFGQFIKLINHVDYFKPIIPNLDITLLNNQTNSLFSSLQDVIIERSDILNYLNLVEKFEGDKTNGHDDKKMYTLLNNNFKDLVKSTNNMKSVTKLITSIGSYTSPLKDLSNSKFHKLIENDDNEFNENLIRGLKTRIKKLEDLLHQQQFRNLNNWPVKNLSASPVSTPPPGDHQVSVALETPINKTTPDNNGRPHNHDSSNSLSPVSPSVNPTSLLRKSSNSAPLDASITIDKHLDNIKLRKENKQLMENNHQLMEENNQLSATNAKQSQEIQELKRTIENLKSSSSEQNLLYENKIAQLNNQVTSINEISKEYKLINESKDDKITELTSSVNSGKNEIKDLISIKNELLSNMTSKESEFLKIQKTLEQEIKLKEIKIDEVMEDYENLIELTTKNSNVSQDLIINLNNVIINLFKHIKSSILLNYDFFIEFVLILESIGLLLVKEYNQDLKQFEYKVTRVKGLRSKKDDESLIDKPSSKVIGDIDDLMTWLPDLEIKEIDYQHNVDDMNTSDGNDDVKSLSTNIEDDDADTNKLLEIYNDIFKSKKFEEFLTTISFKDDSIENIEASNNRFFLSGIAKRFRDVEGFAKKLTKENKLKQQEVHKLTKNLSNKIAMNNFEIGDLVLFLPTRIDQSNSNESLHNKDNDQPWAAFNIGAPHYFLKNKEVNKEWLVAKILNIKQFKVDASNINDLQLNPFKLSAGIVWYLVDAEPQY